MDANEAVGAALYHCRTRNLRTCFSVSSEQESGPGRNVLYFINRGKSYFTFKKARFLGREGDLLVWDTISSPVLEIRGVKGGPFSYTIAEFDLFSGKGVQFTLSKHGRPIRIKVRRPETVRSLLKKIARLYSAKPAHYMQECSGLLLRLLKTMEEEKKSGRPGRDLPDRTDPRIDGVLKFIEDNYKKRLPLNALAEKAGMDRVRFSALFKKQTGMFPGGYVIDRKISKAKDFLSRYNEALLNTGEHLGFHDYSHFYRTFKRKTGMTPAQWARKSG